MLEPVSHNKRCQSKLQSKNILINIKYTITSQNLSTRTQISCVRRIWRQKLKQNNGKQNLYLISYDIFTFLYLFNPFLAHSSQSTTFQVLSQVNKQNDFDCIVSHEQRVVRVKFERGMAGNRVGQWQVWK